MIPSSEMNSDTTSFPMLISYLQPVWTSPTLRGLKGRVPGPIPSELYWANVTHGNISPVDVHVSLLGRADLTGEIYRQLRAAIIAGRLRPGDPLPPTREL